MATWSGISTNSNSVCKVGLLFVEERMDEGEEREEISDGLKDKGDDEMLEGGSEPEDTGHYDLAGSYQALADGIIRYVERRRKGRE